MSCARVSLWFRQFYTKLQLYNIISIAFTQERENTRIEGKMCYAYFCLYPIEVTLELQKAGYKCN